MRDPPIHLWFQNGPAEWFAQSPAARFVRREAAHAFRIVGRTGRNAIGSNAFGTPLDSQRFDEQLDPGFSGADVSLPGDGRVGVIG